jgi:PadR family transcriptional regulator AphA
VLAADLETLLATFLDISQSLTDYLVAMPKVKTFLTPAEYAVLGMVRKKPTYGYELKQRFSGKQGLARVCPIEPAMVYAILKSLSGLELVDGEWDNSTYPPKAIYSATEAGDLEFQRWLLRPVGRIREIRFDFLVKLYFLLEQDPAQARDLIEAQIEICKEYQAGIAEEREGIESECFDAIVLESKASAARITREWLEQALTALDDGSTKE